jgi:hypothetical protein
MPRRHKSSGNQDGKQSQATDDINQAQREAMVMDLRLQGYDFDYIARMAGYANRSGAFKAWQRVMHRIPESSAAEQRKLLECRIEDLMTVYYPKARTGDGWSYDRVMRGIEQIRALKGLDVKPDMGIPAGATIVREIGAPLEQL